MVRILRTVNFGNADVFDFLGRFGYESDMELSDAEKLTRYRDTSPEAISTRLRAARIYACPNQAEFARLVGLTKTTYNSQELRGAPSMAVMNYLYVHKRIGPNFLLLGEFAPLPGDVQSALLEILRDGGSASAT